MELKRLFHSENAGLIIHLAIKDSRGNVLKKKRAQFDKGLYYAMEAENSELEIDELDLVMNHPDHNIRFFNDSNWAEKSLAKLKESEKKAIMNLNIDLNDQLSFKDKKISELEAKIAQMNVKIEPPYEEDVQIEDLTAKRNEIIAENREAVKPKPSTSKRGRKPKNG